MSLCAEDELQARGSVVVYFRTLLIGIAAGLVYGCDANRNPVAPSGLVSPPSAAAPSPPLGPVGDAVLVGAGDIAMCDMPGAAATAALLDAMPGTVFTTGDNAYPDGSARDYAACYAPTWGRHRDRTRPVPGNHEYQTPGAAGYFGYYGGNAGPPGLGYYSYRAGAWLVVALDSNIAAGPGSPQAEWLRATLSAEPSSCTLAYWHHPLFSSGPNGDNGQTRELWRILYDAGAEIVLTGHDHLYERFAPQDADGLADPDRGLRQFIVGTGGAYLYDVRGRRANSETVGAAHGVLRLTLKAGSYDWEFVPVPGAAFSDAGSGACH